MIALSFPLATVLSVASYRYSSSSMARDHLRAAVGLALTLLPPAFVDLAPVASAVLGALAIAFACFVVQNVARYRQRFVLDEHGIGLYPGNRRIAWQDLSAVRLDYYSTRPQGEGGWMALKLRSATTTLRLDSRLSGFELIAQRAAEAARRNGLELSPASVRNFTALGFEFPVPGAMPAAMTDA